MKKGGTKMRWRSLILALMMLLPLTVQARAASSSASEVSKRVAALPSFVVVTKNERPRDALIRVIGCDPLPQKLPTLADGRTVQPEALVGKNVFNVQGESLGVIKDVVIDQQTKEANSVIKLTPALGETNVAIPVYHMAFDKGQFLLDGYSTKQLKDMTPFTSGKNYTGVLASWGMIDVLDLSFGRVLFRIESNPPGARFFVRDKYFGTTEIDGSMREGDKDGIRLELKNYRPSLLSGQ
jgi:hypothetical protein